MTRFSVLLTVVAATAIGASTVFAMPLSPDLLERLRAEGKIAEEQALAQADGECDLEYNVNRGDSGDPWPGSGGTYNPNHAFNLVSTPNTRAYSNSTTGVSVYNIHFAGNAAYLSIAVNLVPPTVKVVGPNGGEAFALGAQDTIRWVAFDDIAVDSVSILLSTDGGATYPTVLGHGQANDSSFIWTVAGTVSEHCKVKVVAYDRSGYNSNDVSDADFEIYDVAGVAGQVTADLRVLSIEPNPTKGGARIVFSSPHRDAGVSIYDVSGRLIETLAPTPKSADGSTFEAYWDGASASARAMPPGVYFVRVMSGKVALTGKLTIGR